MSIQIDGIYGASIGFEFIPHELAQASDDEALWGIMFDLLFFRVIFMKYMD